MESQSIFDAKSFLKQLTTRPGVYRMMDARGEVLYVGKARNLKNRVSSYFRNTGVSIKTRALVEKIADIEITITHSETEALLLEQNLIKTLKPPYNILLRDDKSYPYIYLSSHDEYPSLTFRRVRQKKTGKGRFFGPYTSAAAVRESLALLQKIFRIRQCEDSFFSNRSRPCLQHQIGRCSAPCVGLIDPQSYAEDMSHATMFLEGRNPEIINETIQQMEVASAQLDFERAAVLRDQVDYLRRVQEQQAIEGVARDIDAFALSSSLELVVVHGLFIRAGRVVGSKSFYLSERLESDDGDLLSSFLNQYYFGEHAIYGLPQEITTTVGLTDKDALKAAFKEVFNRNVRIEHNVRSNRAEWLHLAQTNANQALSTRMQSQDAQLQRWQSFCDALNLEASVKRVECFDVSHTFGEATVASCVVFGPEGAIKDLYRRYNIKDVPAGDDYHAMEQALTRRYSKLKDSDVGLPDIILIDGGKGQLGIAHQVFDELQITGVTLIGVAKGVTRKPGMETLFISADNSILNLPGDSTALHLIQQIRDEAHRFAITGHRNQRNKKRTQSVLDAVPGIGPKRRRDLLNYFGSVRNIERASLEEIKRVPGISEVIAQTIYAAFHE
ncbi:excinuclease ABC, C subunit [Hahella chejuensis KCTC 2396]|uniref:UvrABC system protein C n=1 Tax=Hahella chejuensis (strain KCTC 2396) TaxID=349521 RepID=UVRC_HAHCH|nr:excinuclease ABC subunit UvrC [Hahella chejuensis]Q2SF17.1 RecName: Full=UvrABC system protein C; Short=Protein UvrC; AltName: Full=Excinuclease ABC subunit C [Hahella chejuensis KCTC 2396]ABC30757.1 excinuclease ABC, C subunit [Hahella chejuensis KCTC 2396]